MAEDTIRVLRLYSFEGPRSMIEKQLERSLADRTNHPGIEGLTIKVATLGSFPEIMEQAQPVMPQGKLLGYAERDGDEWHVHSIDSSTGQHIHLYNRKAIGNYVFPLYDTVTDEIVELDLKAALQAEQDEQDPS